jgi:hypothetical protein
MTTTTLAPIDIAREFILCKRSPVYFIRTYIQIQHQELGTIPFDLWPWQAALLRRFQNDRKIIILKARQIGVTELAGAYALWLIRFQQSKKAIAISKNDDAAKEIISRIGFSYDQLPPFLQAGPDAFDGCQLGKRNESVLEFLHPNKERRMQPSSIQSLPATQSAGRSKTVALLLLDEWAHQMFDKQIWTGVKATAEKGQVIGISTANGLGNMFHRIWVNAVAQQNGFTPIFLSWRRHPDRDDAWYVREAADNEPWQLHQEYPSEPTEAFIQSGRPVFDHTYLSTHSERLKSEAPPLSQDTGLTIWEEAIGAQRDANGTVTQKEHKYIIAADVSEGRVGGDYDAACVVDRATWRQVAELRGHWPFEEYAKRLLELATRYNMALLAVERNNHGHAVLLGLKEYRQLYHTSDELVLGAEQQKKAGWETTAKTKPLAISSLQTALRDGTYQPRSQAMLDEALIYAYQDNGSMSAPSGYHDDLIIAHAIAVHLLSQPDPSQQALDYVSQWQSLTQQRRAATPPEHPIRSAT